MCRKVHTARVRFCISVIDQNRPTTCATARLDVSPAIPDGKTSTEVDVQVPGCTQQHSRLRLPAAAAIRIIVIADPNIIKRNAAAQEVIDFFDCPAFQTSSGNLRLVRGNDQQEAVTAHPFACFWNPRWDLDLVQSRG